MENLTKNAVSTKEMKQVKDVTKEVKERLVNKTHHYEDSISKITKSGSIYEITFTDGYTAFGQKTRKARRMPEIQWYSRIATEEKEKGFNLEAQLKEFKDNGIAFDGKTIPEFIDTIEDVKAQEAKKAEKQKTETK